MFWGPAETVKEYQPSRPKVPNEQGAVFVEGLFSELSFIVPFKQVPLIDIDVAVAQVDPCAKMFWKQNNANKSIAVKNAGLLALLFFVPFCLPRGIKNKMQSE